MEEDVASSAGKADDRHGSRFAKIIKGIRKKDRVDPWRVALAITVIIAVGTAVFAGVSGLQWVAAANDASLQFAEARDDALRVGQQELLNFYSIDYHNVDQVINRQLDSSTGYVYDLVNQQKDSRKKQITDLRISTQASVTEAAMTELDDRAGTGKFLAVVQVTGVLGQTTSPRLPVQADLTRTDSGWKLSTISTVVLDPTSSSG